MDAYNMGTIYCKLIASDPERDTERTGFGGGQLQPINDGALTLRQTLGEVFMPSLSKRIRSPEFRDRELTPLAMS